MIGKYPTTSQGNNYALTCIDLLTSYVIAIPVPNKTAETVTQAYLSQIMCRFGASKFCLSDNGLEFRNSELTSVMEKLGIKKLHCSPYHPQGNGRLENIHNFIKRTTAKLCYGDPKLEWDMMLPFACYIFNISPSCQGAEPPFYLVHGRDPIEGKMSHFTNFSRFLGDPTTGELVIKEMRKVWTLHMEKLREIRGVELNQEALDKEGAHRFKINQPVLLKNHTAISFDPKYKADYRVLDIPNKCTVVLSAPDGSTRRANVKHVKPATPLDTMHQAYLEFEQGLKQAVLDKEATKTHNYNLRSRPGKP